MGSRGPAGMSVPGETVAGGGEAADALVQGIKSSKKKCVDTAHLREGSAGFLPARLLLSSQLVQICSPGLQVV